MGKIPQNIDYNAYTKALMKAATIEDLQGNPTKAKYYRYKIHTVDLFVYNKVIYKNDVEVFLDAFSVRKFLFKYHLKGLFALKNNSPSEILKLYADFVLKQGNKVRETYTVECVSKSDPLMPNGDETRDIEVRFGKNIYTKKELANYMIEVYVYKDPKYKTLVGTYEIPKKSFGKFNRK